MKTTALLFFLLACVYATIGSADAQRAYSDRYEDERYSVHRKVRPSRSPEALNDCLREECARYDSNDFDYDSPYSNCSVDCLRGYYGDYNEE